MRKKLLIVAAALIGSVPAAEAQNSVLFQSAAVTNSCVGFPITALPGCGMLAFNATTVWSCRYTSLQWWVWTYFPTASAVIPPTYACSFNTCNPANINLYCQSIRPAGKRMKSAPPISLNFKSG